MSEETNPYQSPAEFDEGPTEVPHEIDQSLEATISRTAINLLVRSSSQGMFRGQFVCRVTEEGLFLTKGRKQQFEVPVGTEAQYLGQNRFRALVDGETIRFWIANIGIHQYCLAKDLAAFLRGERPAPDLHDYSLSSFFWLMAGLSVAIPIVLMNGIISTMIGLGVGFAILRVAQFEQWSMVQRGLICLGMMAVSFGAMVVMHIILQ